MGVDFDVIEETLDVWVHGFYLTRIVPRGFVLRENQGNGQQYVSLGMVGNVKIIEKIGNPDQPVAAPYYSHTPGRIYATVKKGELKYLSFYDENHKQMKSIDFDHAHNGVKPHVHFDVNHDGSAPGIPPSPSDWEIIKRIKKEMKLK